MLQSFSRSILFTTTVLVVSLGTSEHVLAATLESATPGSIGWRGGLRIDSSEYLGWRFTLDKSFQVSAIGGHMFRSGTSGNQKIFGAIVSLRSPTALPKGKPLGAQEVVASTIFDPGFPSSEVRTPLSTLLSPGNYALIFGSGQFGATGVAGMPDGMHQDLPGTTYFYSEGISYFNGYIRSLHFVVEGEFKADKPNTTEIPTPVLLPSLIAMGIAMRHKHKGTTAAR